MRYIWFRLLATYGPADSSTNMIPSVIQTLLKGKSPAMTRGEQKWDYLFVEDAAEAISLAGIHPSLDGIFNLGYGKAYTVRTIAERIRDLMDPSLPLGLGMIPYAEGKPMHLEADVSRIQTALHWKPRTNLDKGLPVTVSWYGQLKEQLA